MLFLLCRGKSEDGPELLPDVQEQRKRSQSSESSSKFMETADSYSEALRERTRLSSTADPKRSHLSKCVGPEKALYRTMRRGTYLVEDRAHDKVRPSLRRGYRLLDREDCTDLDTCGMVSGTRGFPAVLTSRC